MKEAMANIYKFNPSAATGPKAEMLPMRLLVGAEVRLPWWDRLSLGLLYSGRYGQGFNWNEGRISLNVSPLNWLSLSGSTSFNDFFRSFGVGLNVHPGIINFFIGTDVIPGRIIPANTLVTDMSFLPSFLGIPTSDLNINGYFGISIAWGKRKVDYKRNYIERED